MSRQQPALASGFPGRSRSMRRWGRSRHPSHSESSRGYRTTRCLRSRWLGGIRRWPDQQAGRVPCRRRSKTEQFRRGGFQRSMQRDPVFGGLRCPLVVSRRGLAGGRSRWLGSGSWSCLPKACRCESLPSRWASAGPLHRSGRTARRFAGRMARSRSCLRWNPLLFVRSRPGSFRRRNGCGSLTWLAGVSQHLHGLLPEA